MKKEEWESIFGSDYCAIDCPRGATEAAQWLFDRNPKYQKQKAFTPQAIAKHAAANAWPQRRKELERKITRQWLADNIGEREEQKKQRDIAYLNASDRLAGHAARLMQSIPEKEIPGPNGPQRVFVDPVKASLVLERAARVAQMAQEMSRLALGFDDHGKGAGDIWDNVVTWEVQKPEQIMPELIEGDHEG